MVEDAAAPKKHYTEVMKERIAELEAENAALKAGAEPVARFSTGTHNPPEHSAFYQSLVVALASSQGMSAFSPDQLAGVKANAAGAYLVWQELCDNHEAAVAGARANAELREKQERDLQARERANREAREARRGRSASMRGQVSIEQRVPPRPGLSAEENALVAAAMAQGALPAPSEA